jgi:hypothetical protein
VCHCGHTLWRSATRLHSVSHLLVACVLQILLVTHGFLSSVHACRMSYEGSCVTCSWCSGSLAILATPLAHPGGQQQCWTVGGGSCSQCAAEVQLHKEISAIWPYHHLHDAGHGMLGEFAAQTAGSAVLQHLAAKLPVTDISNSSKAQQIIEKAFKAAHEATLKLYCEPPEQYTYPAGSRWGMCFAPATRTRLIVTLLHAVFSLENSPHARCGRHTCSTSSLFNWQCASSQVRGELQPDIHGRPAHVSCSQRCRAARRVWDHVHCCGAATGSTAGWQCRR